MVGGRTDNGGKKVLLGRIGAAHGIKGEVRIQSFCADPLDIAAYGPLATNRGDFVVEIASSRLQKDMVIARLKGVADRTAAEKLNSVELYVDRDLLPDEDGDDDFYYTDLIGLAVRGPDGRSIGRVKSIDDFGAGDIVEIALDGRGTALYAFTRANFPEIDIENGVVVLDPPVETEVRGGKD